MKLTVVINKVISLLSASYKILSNIFLSRLSPYIDEIIGDHQCEFRTGRWRIFGLKRDGVMGGWRKLHNEVLQV
jgi:hypothetical protein